MISFKFPTFFKLRDDGLISYLLERLKEFSSSLNFLDFEDALKIVVEN